MSLMQPVTSSNIKGVAYDDETQTLILVFLGGAMWTYDSVPADVHEELMKAESKGKFFAARIKGVYQATKVPAPQRTAEPVNVLAAG